MSPLLFIPCQFDQCRPSNCVQNATFWITSQYRNGMLSCNERHPLLMKCFKTFLRYMRQVKEAPDSVAMSFMGLDMPFLTPVNSQIGHKLPESSYPLSMANGMMYHNERHPLFMKCFKSSIYAYCR